MSIENDRYPQGKPQEAARHQAGYVVQGKRADVQSLYRCDSAVHAEDAGDQVTMGQHDWLGQTGSPAAEEDNRHVV